VRHCRSLLALVAAAGVLVTGCRAPTPATTVPVAAARPAGHETSAPGGTVLDVRAGSHQADDAAVLAATVRAGQAVTQVWGEAWHRPPMVVGVGDTATLARLSGRPVATTVGLVAVTTADRVYLDVPAWLALPAAGRQVLLTHEVTHLATGAATSDLPLWLEEGFADTVGLSGSGLRLRTVAAALLDPVRAGVPPPSTLPSDAAFAAGGTTAAQAYAGAWLACRLVVSRVGIHDLVAVYRAALAGSGSPPARVDAALRAVTGAGTAVWTLRWQAALLADVRRGGPAPGVLA